MPESGERGAVPLPNSKRDLRVLLDTSSLMQDGAEAALDRFFVPLVQETGQKLVIPRQVQDEIKKHTRAPAPDLRAKAERADDLLGRYRALGFVEVFSDGEDTFADNVMQLVIVRFCERYHFCLVTQDRALATDVLRLGERRSVTRAKSVGAMRVGANGGLDEWFLNGRGDAAWRVIEKGDTGVAAVPPAAPAAPTAFALASGAPRALGAPLPLRFEPAEGAVIVDQHGQRMRLGRKLGAGGEGAVFATDGPLVCKTYLGDRLTTGLRDKLALMIARPVTHPAICWPTSLAMNERGECVGYLMPAARGKELQRAVFVKPLLQATFPKWRRTELVALAISVLEPMLALHESNVIIGDINPLNILVAGEREVFFVDCDSYQIEDFACPVGTATFLTPDLLGRNLATVLRDPSHEYFAVATLVFMMLVPGKRPYSHAGGGDPAENVRSRHFPYGLAEKKGEKVPAGPWRYIWSHLPFYVKEAFHEVFTHGERISTYGWIELLQRYHYDLTRGFVSPEIFPTEFKRLRPEDVRRKGGAWLTCHECGEGYGHFDKPGDAGSAVQKRAEVCPTCSVKEVAVPCYLCTKPFLVRASHLRRLAGKEPFCEGCRVLVLTKPCRDCIGTFEITAGDRAHFKRRNLSLPTRCKECRERRRIAAGGTWSPPIAATRPGPFGLMYPPVPPEAKTEPSPAGSPGPAEVRPTGLWDALRRMFGGS